MSDEPPLNLTPTPAEVAAMKDMIVDLRAKLERLERAGGLCDECGRDLKDTMHAAIGSLVRRRDNAEHLIGQMADALAVAATRCDNLELWDGWRIQYWWDGFETGAREWRIFRNDIEVNFAPDPEAPVLRYATAREALDKVLEATHEG